MAKASAREIARAAMAELKPVEPRGLAGFMPTRPGTAIDEARLLPIEDVHPNPYQARQMFSPDGMVTLIDSIREQGVLEPIIVRTQADGFEIVAGERRTRAVKALREEMPDNIRWRSIPAIVRNLNDEEAAVITAAENLLREDLTITDEAAMYEKLVEVWELRPSRASREIARRLGVSRHRVDRARRIGAHPTLAAAVDDGSMTLRAALTSLRSSDESGEDDMPNMERADLDDEESLAHRAPNSELEIVDQLADSDDLSATHSVSEAESLAHRAPNSAYTPARAAQVWRPLHLAYRNMSRQAERVRPDDIKSLPAIERTSLIKTVDETMRQLAELRDMLESTASAEELDGEVAN